MRRQVRRDLRKGGQANVKLLEIIKKEEESCKKIDSQIDELSAKVAANQQSVIEKRIPRQMGKIAKMHLHKNEIDEMNDMKIPTNKQRLSTNKNKLIK